MFLMLFVIIILVILVAILRYYYKTPRKESFQEEKSKIYFNKSIKYHQMEKIGEIIKENETKEKEKTYFSFWNRKGDNEIGYFPLTGSYVIDTKNQINNPQDISISKYNGIEILVKNGKSPIDFILIWKSKDSDNPFSIWKVVPPEGYIVFGDIVVKGFEKPNKEDYNYQCLPLDLVEKDKTGFNQEANNPIYLENDLSIWKIGEMGFFMATHLKDKPIERENEIYKLKEEALNNIEIDPLEKPIKLKIIAKS